MSENLQDNQEKRATTNTSPHGVGLVTGELQIIKCDTQRGGSRGKEATQGFQYHFLGKCGGRPWGQ